MRTSYFSGKIWREGSGEFMVDPLIYADIVDFVIFYFLIFHLEVWIETLLDL